MHLFMESAALISDCGAYRYWLTRTWDVSKPRVCWVMLNPSTADASADDPTIRRCCAFADRWGAGGIVVANLFALRSPYPRDLLRHSDPIGPENDNYIASCARMGYRLLCAWGAADKPLLRKRATAVLALLREIGVQPECLGLTRKGQPVHPLYQRNDAVPVPYGD